MSDFTPKQIVKELDRYIVGQTSAKRAVAIALRNRWRRQQVDGDMRNEIVPNNIILIGPTGVGKTEISRRLAKLAKAPFVKVEASKFTEVGYVGRDVESIIRDLADVAMSIVKKEKQIEVQGLAETMAEERILDSLFPIDGTHKLSKEEEVRHKKTRNRLRQKLLNGDFETREIDIEVTEDAAPMMQIFGPLGGGDDMGMNIKDMLSNVMPGHKKRRKMVVSDARNILIEMEADSLMDQDELVRMAKHRVENNGIVFLDEIDKIVDSNGGGSGPDVSREGVQRDLLPIVEGSRVPTKYGAVKTDHVLFISAGAFHVSSPSDMIPELQGRFPIRVEMNKLTVNDFVKILKHPESSLIKQYMALLGAENVTLKFETDAIREIAKIAAQVNSKMENIGARRLHTVMTTLLDDYMFDESTGKKKTITITKKLVDKKLKDIVEDQDLSKYIL
ncbi:MAG: ATP-dependent protease ATPase subunit HslU [Candidatus Marinimicrobia bacterium]|jgi:ATP-dependent HslUV protease ATP-binding subunit HslU|nr:ATP-dependent protease ATPase subunit HslU [Candidatus Neomarinimicrobiota bacterium]MBT3676848.1 ATP-dependent protease ATPase subunit HslU [Candidatus Neomarinimicrobiota bacterium]MBT3763423.1 ATP-dependent protease ATPase subunit HslU [Candidatus Neomarinimicrobiota bacterium]MBT4068103.1 ATP-dependent protease ATPase subunit HslU [Candidatus Neomarinimicrobiota bacterium]MBT4271197.1 ATP-dependent protease ATPase subunit HslU [Candidatus Neomarinimicrobiota bacterium]